MKNNFITTVLIIFPLFFIQLAQAQYCSKIEPIIEKELTFSGVQNSYTFELKIPTEKADLSSFLGIFALVFNSGSDLFRIEAYLNDKLWIDGCVYLEHLENFIFRLAPN